MLKAVSSIGPEILLARSAIPVINAPTGTMANNGAITLGTALPGTYTSCYLLLPAGAIAAGVPAAATIFYTVMSSTTVGQVFNNTLGVGVPTIPAAPVAFATVGPGAYAGLTGQQTLLQIVVPGNSMGPNGRLRLSVTATNNNSAGTKNLVGQFGGTQIMNPQNTANITLWQQHEVMNRGVTGQQIAHPVALLGPGSTGANLVYPAVDTTVNQTLLLAANDNTATDWLAIESFMIELFPG